MKKIFAANWKLNKTPEQARSFVHDLNAELKGFSSDKKRLMIFPQNFSLEAVLTGFKGTSVEVGPQNISKDLNGAFTGENSADFAKQMGASLALIGHSERRTLFAETDELVAAKVETSFKTGLLPVLCIGETLSEREGNQTEKVCEKQLNAGLSKVVDKSQEIVIAYEPVWAIGTGKVATNEQVKEVHAFIFKKMSDLGFNKFSILYGGSVKADNAADLIKIPYVDGFLIGGASLEVKSFLAIANCL